LWQNAFPELSKGAAEYLFEHLGAMWGPPLVSNPFN
jgi:hypothetical protein